MTRFPTYPPDILARADALLSEKYPDGIVDPRFVEIACEAMMMEREDNARLVDEYVWDDHELAQATDIGRASHKQAMEIAKAIRGQQQ